MVGVPGIDPGKCYAHPVELGSGGVSNRTELPPLLVHLARVVHAGARELILQIERPRPTDEDVDVGVRVVLRTVTTSVVGVSHGFLPLTPLDTAPRDEKKYSKNE